MPVEMGGREEHVGVVIEQRLLDSEILDPDRQDVAIGRRIAQSLEVRLVAEGVPR